jgi:intein/homing endonuclease
MGDWCEFMGWYLSEGCVTLYRDRREVYIAQQKTENIPMIHALLVRMGLTFHYNGRGFVVCNAQLATYLAQFGKAHEKYIPREILELAPPYLACLYSSLLRGDGHQQVRVRKGKKAGQEWVQLYKTTSRRLAGDVQELVLKLGYTASVIPV